MSSQLNLEFTNDSPQATRLLSLATIATFVSVQIVLATREMFSESILVGKILQLALPPLFGIIALFLSRFQSPSNKVASADLNRGLIVEPVVVLIVLSSVAITVPFNDIPNELWEGFGPWVTLISVLLVVSHFSLTRISRLTRLFDLGKKLAYALCLIGYFLYLPTFIQTPGGIININDTTYHVLDEMLAPMSGQLPHSTYMPTYTAMFGWIIAPLANIGLSASALMALVISFANIFFISIPILIALTVKRIEPRAPLFILPLMVIPLMGISGPMNGSSTILSGFSTFGRFFFPYFTTALGAIALTSLPRPTRIPWVAIFGVASSVTLLNNADFCFSFVVATLLSLLAARLTEQIDSAVLRRYFAGFFGFLFIYIFILLVAGRGFDIRMYSSLVLLGQRGDLYFYEMAKFGPHLLVFISAVAALALGIARSKAARTNLNARRTAALNVALLQSGLWTLALLMMFAVRPIIPFATQQLLIPMIVNFMLIGIVVFGNESWSSGTATFRQLLRIAPLLLVLSLPIASIIQVPNPIDEAKRVLGHARHPDWSSTPGRAPADGWTPNILRQQGTLHHPGAWLEAIEGFALSYQGDLDDVGYFGYMGNTVQMITGIHNVMGVSGPEHMRFGDYFEQMGCAPIGRIRPKIVLVYASPVPCTNLQFLASDKSGTLQIYLVRNIAT